MHLLKALAFSIVILTSSSLWGEDANQSSVGSNNAIEYLSYCETCDVPAWKIRAGAIFLQRNTLDSRVLLEDTITTLPVLNSSGFNFNSGAGPDISFIRSLGDGCRSIEARYFGVDNISATQALVTPAIWNFPTEPPLFGLGVANIVSTYTSRLYSSEINLRQEIDEDITFLVGFRWVEMYDRLNYAADFGGNQANIAFDTNNRLYGAQIGLNLRVWDLAGPFRVDGVIKAGIFGNAASNEFIVTQAIGPAFGTRDNESETAFLGEVSLICTYQLTNNLAIRGGYQLLWLDRVAVASDQAQVTNVIDAIGIDSSGGAFFHGATANIEYSW